MGVFGGVEKVRALGANGVVKGSTIGAVWFEVSGGMVSAKVVLMVVLGLSCECLGEFSLEDRYKGDKEEMFAVEEALEQALSLFKFRGFSSFDGKKLVHVVNRIKSVVTYGIISHSLVWRRRHESKLDLREMEDRGWGEDHNNEDGTNLFINIKKKIKTNCRKDVVKIWFILEEVRKDDPSFVKESIYERLINLSFFPGKASSTMIHGNVVGGVMMINVDRFRHDVPKNRESRKAHLLEDKQIQSVGVFDEVVETASQSLVTTSKYSRDDVKTFYDDVKVVDSEMPEEDSTAVIDVAQRKCEADAVILLKRIRKFFMTQDIRAHAAVHICNRIGFSIAKGVGAQIVSRLPSNFL
ncbi:hypothetical protein Tco_1491784 [Tanacetum coccineum]